MNKYMHLFISILPVITSTAINASSNIKTIPWPMYQQNASHTGYVDTNLNSKYFKFKWKINGSLDQYQCSFGLLSGVVVANKSVFFQCSNTLQAVSIVDGKELWHKTYNVSINPPSVANGKVYIQAVNNYSPETALYALDAKSGKIIFKSPTDAQWENYLAPTIFDNNVYINGGTYGGMYSIDANEGDQNWFVSLAQYDRWTPAVNKNFAIAYTDGQLNVVDRISGKTLFNIKDSHFDWHGWSTNFAPVFMGDDQAIAIQSGYLSIFDFKNKNVKWSKGPGFAGQPAYDNKYIYAAQNDGLIVLDKEGKVQWKWFQDNELVRGQIIVTNDLVFLTTNDKTYALSKKKHNIVWSYPTAGVLSLGMGQLFIADIAGEIIAIKITK